jgi:serine protease Do
LIEELTMRISKFAGIMALGCASFVAAQPPPSAATAPPSPRAKAAVAPASGSYIGVMVQEIDGDRAKTLKLREEAGVEITHVEADSPADKAGLKMGDAILQYNGQRVEGMEQFSRLVRETPPGREVKLDVFRNGAAQVVTVKVAARHPGAATFNSNAFSNVPAGSFEFQMPDMPRSFMSWQSSMFGIEGESLEGQLAQYFGVKEGVLVRSVIGGSAAEKGGLKAGDVIVRVDDAKVTTPTDITSRLRTLRGKPVSIVVMRDHREVPLSVTIDEEKRGGFLRLPDFGGPNNEIDYFTSPLRPRVISWPRD